MTMVGHVSSLPSNSALMRGEYLVTILTDGVFHYVPGHFSSAVNISMQGRCMLLVFL